MLDEKIKTNSTIMKTAIGVMRKREQITEEEHEEVIDPFELMLVLNEISNEKEKRGKWNAKRI